MREARVVVVAPDACAHLRVLRAESFADRLRGLLGREGLVQRYGIWICPCSAVHTFGMRAAIDIVFVDRQYRVLKVETGLGPCRLRVCRGARAVLELPPGAASRLGFDRPAARLTWPEATR